MAEINIQFDSEITRNIWNGIENNRDKKKRKYLGMSQIGDKCSRKLWYDFRGYTKKLMDPRMYALFSMGDDIELRLIEYLGYAGYEVLGQQLEFSDHDYFFRGHCDGTIDGITKQTHILECKSCNDKNFKEFKKKGLQEWKQVYYAQCQVYMGYSKLNRALLIAMNKNNSDIHAERIYFDKKYFIELKYKAAKIICSSEIPDKIENCQWCDFEEVCSNPAKHFQKEKTCGTCFNMREFLKCDKFGDIPQDFWGVNECDNWEIGGVPF